MNSKLKVLVKSTPNDAELGAKVREYVNNNETCCDDVENIGTYTDNKGQVYAQCLKCGKLLI